MFIIFSLSQSIEENENEYDFSLSKLVFIDIWKLLKMYFG